MSFTFGKMIEIGLLNRFLDRVKFLRRNKLEMSGLIYLVDALLARQQLLFSVGELTRFLFVKVG